MTPKEKIKKELDHLDELEVRLQNLPQASSFLQLIQSLRALWLQLEGIRDQLTHERKT